METIKNSNLNIQLASNYIYSFNIPHAGIFAIEITASARSWWQNLKSFKSFFNDDDMAVTLDGKEFRKLNGKGGLMDGEAAWNGNNLKGLIKTTLIVSSLLSGEHQLRFLVNSHPFLERITVYKIDNQTLEFIPSGHNPAQDGSGRQWITIVIDNMLPGSLIIEGVANQKENSKDDDDLKLIIDGTIQKNNEDKSHKNWYWCGRILKGQTKVFDSQLNLTEDLHYIELWADKTPSLNKVILEIKEFASLTLVGRVALHKDMELAESVSLRSEPNNKNENVLAKLTSGESVEIIQIVSEGEKISNRSNIWHKVKYQNLIGYIFSAYVEIEGQERNKIIEKIQSEAKKQSVDLDYAVALAGCESFFKPYAISDWGALGVFQLTSTAREDIREKLHFEINDSYSDNFNVDKNVPAAITYLRWLFEKYSGKEDKYKKVTAAWNAGRNNIPADGPLTYKYIKDEGKRKEAKQLVERVEKNRARKDWQNIILSLAILFVVGASFFGIILNNITRHVTKSQVLGSVVNQPANKNGIDTNTKYSKMAGLIYPQEPFFKERILKEDAVAWEGDYYYDFNNDGTQEIVKIKEDNIKEEMTPYFSIVYFNNGNEWKEVSQKMEGSVVSVSLWKPDDIVIIQTGQGQYINNYFFEFDKSNNKLKPIFVIEGNKTEFGITPAGSTEFLKSTISDVVDANILVTYFPLASGCQGVGEFYKLYKKDTGYVLVKTWNLKQTEQDCKYYERS